MNIINANIIELYGLNGKKCRLDCGAGGKDFLLLQLTSL